MKVDVLNTQQQQKQQHTAEAFHAVLPHRGNMVLVIRQSKIRNSTAKTYFKEAGNEMANGWPKCWERQ